jgi:hypothetical protein
MAVEAGTVGASTADLPLLVLIGWGCVSHFQERPESEPQASTFPLLHPS